MSDAGRLVKRLQRTPSFLLGFGVFITITLTAYLAPYVVPLDPLKMDYGRILHPPDSQSWFGTDELGRDVFARVIFGARTSLAIGFQVMLISAIFGSLIGLATGVGRRADEIIMRVMDVFMAFPALLLALAILAALGSSTMNVVIALSLVYTPRTARVVRGQVLSLKENLYVEAAAALGSKMWRILLFHVFPGVIPALIVQETFLFAYAMLGEAGLSFIGVGVQPPTASWGNILGDGRVLLREAPWLIFFPGAAITAAVLSLNLLGDGLREILDPRRTVR